MRDHEVSPIMRVKHTATGITYCHFAFSTGSCSGLSIKTCTKSRLSVSRPVRSSPSYPNDSSALDTHYCYHSYLYHHFCTLSTATTAAPFYHYQHQHQHGYSNYVRTVRVDIWLHIYQQPNEPKRQTKWRRWHCSRRRAQAFALIQCPSHRTPRNASHYRRSP